jgi:hypothetical protein
MFVLIPKSEVNKIFPDYRPELGLPRGCLLAEVTAFCRTGIRATRRSQSRG